jgi:hypothetical protein
MNDPIEAIRRHGYAVLEVAPDLGADPPRPGYAVTVGLLERGHPNLLILGLPGPMSRMILATLADHGLNHDPLPLNAPLAGFFDGLEPVLRPLDESSAAAWLNRPLDPAPIGWSKAQQLQGSTSSRHLPGDRARLLQVVWPDSSGHYPWEDEFDDALRPAQPLLGSTAGASEHGASERPAG